MKSILIVVIATVLILVAAPTVATASMEMMPNSCDTNPLQKNFPILTCCLTTDCLLSDCSLSNTTADKVLLTSRSIPNKNFYIALYRTSVSTKTSLDPQNPLQRDPTQELPTYLYTEYHCRNCLDSEEPHQV